MKFKIGDFFKVSSSINNLEIYQVIDIQLGYEERVNGRLSYKDVNADMLS